jgi:hypothetical protein
MDRERTGGDRNKSKTLGPVASLLAANHDRNNKLGNERYLLHMQVLLECCYIYIVNGKI